MAFANTCCLFMNKKLYISIKSLLHLSRRAFHFIPFQDFYYENTGGKLSEVQVATLKKKHPAVENLSHEQLKCSLNILKKFNITAQDACNNVHILCMNPISVDNYGEILKECGFIKIIPEHIIHYHTVVRSRNIAHLKRKGLMQPDIELEECLFKQLKDLPTTLKVNENFKESETSILTVRKSVLQKYLVWRLSITHEVFEKYCNCYLPLKHKPLCDIQESLHLAQNVIGLDIQIVKRNGFIIASDPINTKLILENVEELSGYDIKEAIKIEPAILKSNYNALLQIRNLLEEYRIPEEAQRRGLKIYCMKPSTVKERLDDLLDVKEYKILSTNPRVLSLVIHKKKMEQRLQKIEKEKKQCFSLNLLVSSRNVFNNYISNFGDKICGRDIGILIASSLDQYESKDIQSEAIKQILKQMRKHKFWLHSALHVIDSNIKFLKKQFSNQVILENCQLLLYPDNDIQIYINYILDIRKGLLEPKSPITIDWSRSSLKCNELTDSQVLSLVLYEIEKEFHFSGDGIWPKQEAANVDACVR